MDEISVLIVDDQALVRQGLKAMLEPVSGVRVIGEAPNGSEAVRQARRTSPDVVFMDVHMPGMDGLEATRRICEQASTDTKVIILTLYDQDEHVFDALRAGASGFLLKDSPPEKIIEAVCDVASGGALLSSSITRRLIREFVRRPAPAGAAPELAQLSGRERDVFELLVQGYSNQDMANALFLGESTVKSHIQHLYQKLGMRDRVQVVIYAYENGLVSSGPSRGGARPPSG